MIIEKICVAKIFWNELQQRWLKSNLCNSIHFCSEVCSDDKTTFHTRET